MKKKMPWEVEISVRNDAGVDCIIRVSIVSLKATMFADGEKLTKGYLCDLFEFFRNTYNDDVETMKKAVESMHRSSYEVAQMNNAFILHCMKLAQF